MGLFGKRKPDPKVELSPNSQAVLLSSSETIGQHLRHAYEVLKASGALTYFEQKLLGTVAFNAANPEKALRAIVEDPAIGHIAKTLITSIKRGFTNA